MNPVATTFFFYFLSILAVASAIAVITRKNAVHAALALIVTLVSLAGLYLMLYAPFVAGVQIVLYAGNHGAVPVRDHAGEPGPEHPRNSVQQAMDGGADCSAGTWWVAAVRDSYGASDLSDHPE